MIRTLWVRLKRAVALAALIIIATPVALGGVLLMALLEAAEPERPA